MRKKVLRGIRGISPLIATLILIGATIAGGAAIYGVMRSQSSSLAPGGDFEIQSVSLIPDNNITLMIKDTGTVTITKENVSILGEASVLSYTDTISPGRTWGKSDQISLTTNFTSGEYRVVKVSVEFKDGSALVKTASVRVE